MKKEIEMQLTSIIWNCHTSYYRMTVLFKKRGTTMNWYADACTCSSFSHGSFYSLFVGLNDTCGNQRLPTEQAMTFIQEVCACKRGRGR